MPNNARPPTAQVSKRTAERLSSTTMQPYQPPVSSSIINANDVRQLARTPQSAYPIRANQAVEAILRLLSGPGK